MRRAHRFEATELSRASPIDHLDDAHPSQRSERGLDWLSFFVADVQTAFGPFVALYLSSMGWPQGEIGLALAVGGLASVLGQVPAGALIDVVASKRLLIAGAVGFIAAGALILAFWPTVVMVFLAEILHGTASAVIAPALAAIGLGLVGHAALSRRLGRNHRYEALGNAVTAGVMGVLGQFIARRTTFLVGAALCVPAVWFLMRIRGDEIDYARARSASDRKAPRKAARLRHIAKNRLLLVFIGSLLLFQFANASIMPLASERLSAQHAAASELITSALVIVPQFVTAIIAAWIARRAQDWGRKPLLLAGFAVLPLRAVLFAVAPGPWYLVAVQSLGGLTAAVIGIMTPLVIADVTRGSGRYNVAQGAAGTAIGIGAAVSTVISGYVAQFLGFTAGFLGLASVALAGLALINWSLPETRPTKHPALANGVRAE